MITVSSPEKRHLVHPQRLNKTRKLSLDYNQNSTENEFLHIKTKFPVSPCNDFIPHKDLLINLSTLDLSNNKLAALPESLFLLNNLDHLKIDNIGISSLPSRISTLRSLKHLDASGNQLQDLPDDLGRLGNLEILNLNFNDLSKFPISCEALNHLKQLLLSNNRFRSVPECVEEGMKNLEILDISHNPLKFISPPASRKLKRFSAKGLKYCRFFPEWLLNSKFWKLDEIILDYSVFSQFRFRENSITHLRSLSMSNSSLNDRTLEKITSNMVELQKINVTNNEQLKQEKECNTFCFLPGSNLKNPGIVKEINARITGLSILPHSIGIFCNLKRLDIGQNKLCWLPDEICVLQNLQVLIIDSCGLDKLPKKFGDLNKLEEIIACSNKLLELPKSMASMKNLMILDLFNNELSEMPTCLDGEKLNCLDVEKNLFEVNNPLMRNTPYDVLRERLRQRYNYERDVGSKPYKEDVAYDFDNMKSSNSCGESECGEIITDLNGWCTENWDLADDSTDEYEPTREAKSKRPPPRSLKQFHVTHSSYFRPSDLHSRRVRDVVRRMKKKGLRKNSTCSVEDGQFDDA